jgi:polyisoprenoid-binding protein YceI
MTVQRTPRIQSRFAAFAVVVGIGFGLAGATASAEPMEQKIDMTHTSVHFNVWHGGFTPVSYFFRAVESFDLTFDREDVSKSKVKVVIDAASLDSNHFYRDNFTRSETFLNVKKFPKATFESTKISKTGDNTGKMTGNLTLMDQTKEVTFDVTYNKSGKHLSGKYTIDGFTAKGTFKRTDFGMKAFIPWVGDEIEVVVQVEAHRPNPPESK